MIKVLAAIVAPPHLSVSGGARAGELLSAALVSHCDVTVANMMTAAEQDPAVRRAIGVKRIPVRSSLPPVLPWGRLSNRYRTLFYRSNIPEIVREGGFDLVHIHNPMPALEMRRVAKACVASGVPYIVSTHGFNEVANGGRIYGFDPARRLLWKHLVEMPVRQTVQRAAAIFALSPADFDILQDMGGAHVDRSVVSNGVPTPSPADFDADLAVMKRLQIAPGRAAGQITCMFLANHTPNKGLPTLLSAFAALKRPYLLIVGGEKRDEIDYHTAMRACGPGQQIVVTGRLEDSEVAALFRRSDLFVFPTLADTFPLVVLEAMSHGVPVIASRVGGIPHQINESCGILVEPGRPDELAAAVDALADDPARCTAMGAFARTQVSTRFTWANAAAQAFTGYERVLRRHRIGADHPIGGYAAEASNDNMRPYQG